VRDAHEPEPQYMSSTGELIDIERVTISSEGGRWKSTHRGNSLAAYPTSRAVLRGLGGSNPARLPGGVRVTGSSTSSRLLPLTLDAHCHRKIYRKITFQVVIHHAGNHGQESAKFITAVERHYFNSSKGA